MIDKIISGLIQIVMQLVNLLLTPATNILNSLIPDLSSYTSSISSFLGYCTYSIGWVFSAFGIPPAVISLLIAYYTFVLTAPLAVWAIKLVVKWYHYLVP